jgi:hypothetical protein
MLTVRTRIRFATLMAAMCLAVALPGSAETVFKGSGTPAATSAHSAFIAAIGGANNGGNPPPQASGFRAINWDAVKLDGTDFNGATTVISAGKTVGIPVNRFQGRGVLFDEVYSVSGDGYVSVNPNVAGLFPFFSASNVFAPFNGNNLDVAFVLPSDPSSTPAPAAVSGFGAIFENVQKPNVSAIEYFNGNVSLGKYFVPEGPVGATEFLGVLFDAPVVTRVQITLGNGPIFSFFDGKVSAGPAGAELVATDDFAYAEPAAAPTSFFLPSSAHAPGANGSFFTTDLAVSNRGAADASFTVKFLGNGVDGRGGADVTQSVGAGKAVTIADVLASTFGISNGFGALRISSSSSDLKIFGQTSTPGPSGGTFGQSVPALTGTDLVFAGAPRSIVAIREDAAFRTDLFLVNTTEGHAHLTLTLVGEDGTVLASQVLAPFAPLEMRQISSVASVLAGSAYGSVTNATVIIAPQTAGSAFAAYASVIDNTTNDPRTLLAR